MQDKKAVLNKEGEEKKAATKEASHLLRLLSLGRYGHRISGDSYIMAP